MNIYECDRPDLFRYGIFNLCVKLGRCLELGVVLINNCAAAILTAFGFVATCGLTFTIYQTSLNICRAPDNCCFE